MLMPSVKPLGELENPSEFVARHIGIGQADETHMLSVIGEASRRALIDGIVPRSIARSQGMQLPPAVTEAAALAELKALAQKNKVFKSFIGQGYHGTLTPGVILRNVLENPAWYTAYTPYQAEISQGRMEALVNFQTMVSDLTGMAIANASMLDEATAAAEAMTLAKRSVKSKGNTFIVSGDVHPQIIEVVQTRAKPLGLTVKIAMSGEEWAAMLSDGDYFAAFTQYPASSGWLHDWTKDAATVHGKQAAFIVAADPARPHPAQAARRDGCGHRHRHHPALRRAHRLQAARMPAYMACKDEFKRSLPGRLVGVSVDVRGQPAYRLVAADARAAHPPRKGHVSNICTAQVLLAVMASMYAVYHGPQGLKAHRQSVARRTPCILASGLEQAGLHATRSTANKVCSTPIALHTKVADRSPSWTRRGGRASTCARPGATTASASVSTSARAPVTLEAVWRAFGGDFEVASNSRKATALPEDLLRTSDYLTHPIFHMNRAESEMVRYIRRLSDRDLALDRAMIPLGSCTMKLNATAEMLPITWPEFAEIHPFVPADQAQGYRYLIEDLSQKLCDITGYDAVSMQPNSGAQGEYAGLLTIRAYHLANGNTHRDVCLIPTSAHGTNPASAQMVGMKVVVVKVSDNGDIDMDDFRAKAEQYAENLAVLHDHVPLHARRL
jgi:glycine dehydrogenase